MEEQQTISIAEIERENTKERNEKIIEFELSDGKKAEMDLSKANGHLLMKARMQQNARLEISQSVFVLALLCKIDGRDYSVDEILDLPLEDVLLLEMVFQTKKKPQTD